MTRPVNRAKLLCALRQRVKKLREAASYPQEDIIPLGFSAFHWRQIEAGCPITVTTPLGICNVFKVRADRLIQGLDKGIFGR